MIKYEKGKIVTGYVTGIEKYGIFGFKGSAENLPRLGFGDFTYESFAFIETEDGASLSGVRMDKWYAMCFEPGFYALRCVKN